MSSPGGAFGRDLLAERDFLPGGRPGLAAGMTLCLPRMVFRGLTEMKHVLRVGQRVVAWGVHAREGGQDLKN